MQFYILDALNRRQTLVDSYISAVWVERFDKKGELQLVVASTYENRLLFRTGKMIACDLSYRVMLIETAEKAVDDEGRSVINVSGYSLESIFENRVAKDVIDELETYPTWDLTGTPGAIARQIVHDICVTGILSTSDIITNLVEQTILPESMIAESSTSIDLSLEPQSVYEALTSICTDYALGFRILRNGDNGFLYFDVYSGNNRTSAQTTFPAVIFSPELDSLENTTEYVSTDGMKNVAYAFAPTIAAEIYPDWADPDAIDFERRVLVVKSDADNIDDLTTDAKTELAKYNRLIAFDGEITASNPFVYDEDYYLGDIVEVRNTDGAASYMRVTEQIISSDANGVKSYPTFTIDTAVSADVWAAQGVKVWDDYTTEYWDDV